MRSVVVWMLGFCWVWAGHIGWYGSFDKALQKARSCAKPMLVVLVRRDCPPCGELVAALAADGLMARLIDEKTVPVLVTKEYENYPIELLYTLEYPTIFLLSPEETFLMVPMQGSADLLRLRRRLEKEVSDERQLLRR
jgi:hypothetical protein